ncbi:response regulator [Arabiibacter massiliensis]|uniref:response regulator n=1 Tax=Arabiibacter massiliensis TaxID=1870985 RepID=UPI0009BC096D|nr:HD domain-containing phosphohydrolase [Arabiibacter massiliensis]
MSAGKRQTILIVDDTALNRSLLSDILSQEYDILEARDGVEAVELLRRKEGAISLLLLDIVMPNMDGFDVLAYLHRHNWSAEIPVIVISAETSPAYIRKGFELGVVDYVNRPFDPEVVLQRVRNTIALYAKQSRLKDLVVEQVGEREKTNTLMVDILSTIVEFRNGESGLHVTRIRIITELLLEAMKRRFPEYELTPSKIALISNAAALHDIGKIATPEEILNKPGRLTPEEFEIMKEHAAVGDDMLAGLHFGKDEHLVQYARQICRWHHERWDGGGYPDGLVGAQIPVAAQAVSLADVYDALVSARVYKPPYTHEQAIAMITNGECGAFNPDLLQCFLDDADYIKEMVRIRSDGSNEVFDVGKLSREVMERTAPGLSDRTVLLLERERVKTAFFASLEEGVLFDFDPGSDTLVFSGTQRAQFGLPEIVVGIADADVPPQVKPAFGLVRDAVYAATEDNPVANVEFEAVDVEGVRHACLATFRVIWLTDGGLPRRMGTVGRLKVVDGSA